MSSSIDIDKVNIAKLNDSNYGTWHKNMMMVLISKDYWPLGAPAASPPASAAAGGEQQQQATGPAAVPQWDKKALALIYLSLEEHMKSHIDHCTTALQAWDTLKDLYRSSSSAQALNLMEDFQNLKLRDQESISHYVARGRSIRDRLVTGNNTITERDLVIRLLRGLPLPEASSSN